MESVVSISKKRRRQPRRIIAVKAYDEIDSNSEKASGGTREALIRARHTDRVDSSQATIQACRRMSRPVDTDRWAGNFDCSVCRRKRLVGSEFSERALERYRKTGGSLKCNKCTAEQEERERSEAASKRKTASASCVGGESTCSSCKKTLPVDNFNRNQLAKKEKARCRSCVEKSIRAEESTRESSKKGKIDEIKRMIREAETKGDVQERLKWESQLSALEAEFVTGLKPIVMGRGRGRRGRGRAGR